MADDKSAPRSEPSRDGLTVVCDADACVPANIRQDLGILTAPLDAAPAEPGEPGEPDEPADELRADRTAWGAESAVAACLRAAGHSAAVLYVGIGDGHGGDPAFGAAAANALAAQAPAVAFHYAATRQGLMGSGWAAVAAAVAARDGADLATAAAIATATAAAGETFALLEHPAPLEHPAFLEHSGRSEVTDGLRFWLRRLRLRRLRLGRLWLGRRPALVRLADERLETLARPRSRADGIVQLRNRLRAASSAGDGYLRVAVHHVDAAAAAEATARWIGQAVAPEELIIAPLTRHAADRFGPGMLGLAWYTEPR